jgi:O-antigen ligase
MNETIIKNKLPAVTDIILAMSVAFLPVLQVCSLICWGSLILFLIYKNGVRDFFYNLKHKGELILFCLLYLFYLVGMLWTNNIKTGFEDLFIMLPLLFFPLLFSNLKVNFETYRLTAIGLLSGCSLAIIICLVNSFFLYMETGDLHKFFYTSFSFINHPTYFTMFLNLGLLIVCHNTLNEKERIFHSGKLRVFLFFLFVLGVVLLNARLAMSTVFLTLIIFVVAESIKNDKLKSLFPRFIIQSLVVITIFFVLIKFNNRFVQISNAIQDHKDTTAVLDTSNKIYYNSTTIRMGLFKNSMNVFQKNFITGVGTGDVIDASVAELKTSNQEYLAKHYTGAHNQYLQTAMALGIIGLLLLLACIIFPLKNYLRNKNYLAICFVIIVLVNGMGDTILRASSLYFFTFFGCFFYMYNRYQISNLRDKD